jgi:hypothetical protein
MRLIWDKTKDYLDIDVDNIDVASYWVESLNKTKKNQFHVACSSFRSASVISVLLDCLEHCNTIFAKLGLDPLMDISVDFTNQNNLNILHERWVKIQQKHKIVELLDKISNKQIVEKFHKINSLIHEIENQSRIEYTNDNKGVWQIENVFGPSILKFGIWQIELHYQNLGRSSFDKWIHYDSNFNDTDTNNFSHFGALVYFNLTRSYTMQPPIEYVEYCKKNKIEPHGNVLPIGNFKIDFFDLTDIFKKNVRIENNKISFEI